MLDLAKLAPESIDKFSMIRGLESSTIKRHGEALLAEIKQAKSVPKEQWPVVKKTQPLSQQQNAIVDALMAFITKNFVMSNPSRPQLLPLVKKWSVWLMVKQIFHYYKAGVMKL